MCMLSARQVRSAGRRPEGEGANLDRHLVPYHGRCKRIQSGIEFIYLFIYLYICINCGPHARGIGILTLVNTLQQKLIWNWFDCENKPETVFTAFFFPKRDIIFFGTKEHNLQNKTALYYYGLEIRVRNNPSPVSRIYLV